MIAENLPSTHTDSKRDRPSQSGFAPVIPLSIPYRRARSWAARMRAGRVNASRMALMLEMERQNRG